jgi:ERCC4-type nuclease
MFFDLEALDVGDVQYIDSDSDRVVCLIERKTLSDYASSITDKRSKNQSMRIQQMRRDNPDMIVIYLIEGGTIPKDYMFRNGITRDRLYSSFVNRVVRDRFTLYRTHDINDTALIVTKLYDKLTEQLTAVADGGGGDEGERVEYLHTIKLSKKDNMTPLNCYTCQLAQIPGVSIDMADQVAKVYPSMFLLFHAYEKQPTTKQKERLLSEIMLPIVNEKSRRLGPVVAKRIYQYLYGIEEGQSVPTPTPTTCLTPPEPAPQQEAKPKISLKLRGT